MYYGLSVNLMMDTEQNTYNCGMESLTNLVWSTYDRIHFRAVKDFKDFFISDPALTKWTGNIQSLHLYAKKNDSYLGINSSSDKKYYLFDSRNPDHEYPLGMIMSVKMNDLIFSKDSNNSNEEIIKCIKDNIEKCKFNQYYDIFFSLGEEDLVFVVLGHSIDEFLIIVNLLRNITFEDTTVSDSKEKTKPIYSQTYSFVFQNTCDCKSIAENKFSYSEVYLSLIDGVNENTFCNEFNKQLNPVEVFGEDHGINSTLMIGEYDIKYTFKKEIISDEFFKLYSSIIKSGNILNGTSDFYKEYILRSKTIWCCDFEEIKKCSPEPENYICPVNQIVTSSQNPDVDTQELESEINALITNIYEEIRESREDLFFVYNNVISFLKEVKLILNSVSNKQWKYIVSKQIRAFMQAYHDYKNALGYNNELVSDLNDLIADMRKSFYHINRSKDMFYNIPTNSLQYSGSFNKILLAYYGFINELLRIAFKKPHIKGSGTEQSDIVFFIFFSMSPKIHSTLYFSDNANPNGSKIVVFDLPYSALFDFEKYFISLTHEVYHLIAPVDRGVRNKKLIKLWTIVFIKSEIINYLKFQFPEVFLPGKVTDLVDSNSENRIAIDFDFEYPKLVEEFCAEYEFKLNNIENLIKCANFDAINKFIQLELTSDDRTKDYYQTVIGDFIDFCSKYHEKPDADTKLVACAEKITKTIHARIELKDSGLRTDYVHDRNTLWRMKSILAGLKETICDTNVLFLAYPSLAHSPERAMIKLIDYLLNFFDSNGVIYDQDSDAHMRIILLWNHYKNKTLLKLDLKDEFSSESHVEKVKDILSGKKIPTLSELETKVINDIIQGEEFFPACIKYYDTDTVNEIVTEARSKISECIKSVSPDSFSAFSSTIDAIVRLNKPFELTEKKESVYLPDQTIDLNNDTKPAALLTYEYPYTKTYTVSDFDVFLRVVKKTKAVKGPVWYRGICNMTYKLLPSLYVNLPGGKDPYAFQHALLRQSYYETRKHYSTFSENETPLAARQALMQHYGVPTNLLDFSTDPLSALYWALNPENDNDKANDKSPNPPNAVVYAFYPHHYEMACRYLLNSLSGTTSDVERSFIYGIYSHNSLGEEYIISDESDQGIKDKIDRYKKEVKDYHDNPDDFLLYKKIPLPLVVPQKNIRINSQEGTFLAYNFFGIPVGEEDPKATFKRFNYLSLADIQERYVAECLKHGEEPKDLFLERIIISKYSKSKIRDDLNAIFGYTIKRVYPDIPHLLGDVKKNTVGYEKQYK